LYSAVHDAQASKRHNAVGNRKDEECRRSSGSPETLI
jgi:hypothetical protein